VPIATGFTKPVFLTFAPGDTARLFVVEREGTIGIVKDGERLARPFLAIQEKTTGQQGERGLLSMAFDPKYQTNGFFYICYTALSGDVVVARYQVSEDPDVADPNSERIILQVPHQEHDTHNGGLILFGPDGYLYIGIGDGGGYGDPVGNAQNLSTLLGKLLRIDVHSAFPYAIPPDNPFVNRPDARPEIWAYGLRNPWRFSFDHLTGDLYIADVGQDKWEEVNFQPASSKGGENYGWNLFEGFHDFQEAPSREGLVFPLWEYGRPDGCSVTGGYVYRGTALPELVGRYLFADFCSGKIWTLTPLAGGDWQRALLLASGMLIVSFSEGPNGELYVLDYGEGGIYRLAEVG